MKTLPDNPHLDHLRRQAKDLRAARPGMTLAEAQALLADQYGFAGWAELKAEVGRSHGQADTADPALARQIADRFGLGEVTGAMRSLARPDESGRRWQLTTAGGRWTARTVDDVYPPTDGEENARFQEAAARAGVTLPAPVRSRRGAVTEEAGGNSWRVYEWVPTGPPLVAPVSADVARAAGALLAVIHRLRVPVQRICPWSSARLSSRSWPEIAEVAAEKQASWAPLLVAAVPGLLELDDLPEGAPGEPVMCHNNFNPGNLRAAAGGRLVVTGWEHAAGLPPAWELCSALVSWAPDDPRSFLDGYGEVPPLDLGSFRGTATAMQNYVAGQIDLALTDPSPFHERNVRHLLTHLPSRATYRRILDTIDQ